MAILDILQYPDPRLRTKAAPVTKIDAELLRMVDDMYETMYAAPGIGLAATQVNIHLNFFVIDVSEDKSKKMCVLNPEILHKEGEVYEAEGCLSVEGGHDKVKRAAKVKLRGMDLQGKTFEMDAEGLLAVCIQHEVDHLNGILFIDHLSKLKKDRITDKIKKSRKK